MSHGGKDGAELSTIASIDQGRLLLTPLAKLICPPPMSAATLNSSIPCINSVAWGQGGKLAILGSGVLYALYVCICLDFSFFSRNPVPSASFDLVLFDHLQTAVCKHTPHCRGPLTTRLR